ncbi:MAG: hypothetical protein WD471_01665 [Candidatus Paceibacterota bacterium]
MNKKILIPVLILSIGIISSFLIINKEPSTNSEEGISYSDNEKQIDSNLDFTSKKKEITPSMLIGDNKESSSSNENITNLLAQKFGVNVTNGEGSDDIEKLLRDEGFEDYFNGIIFKEEDISVSNNDSEENKIEYLENVDSLLKETFKDLNKTADLIISDFLERGDSRSIELITTLIPKFLEDMIAIKVPPSLKEAHLKMLNVWGKKLASYRAILNIDEDPLKAYLALENFMNIAEEDIIIQSTLSNHYDELIN